MLRSCSARIHRDLLDVRIRIILGAAALVTAALAVRRPDIADHESTTLEALLGMLAGVFGIAAGLIFLVCALPNL